MPAVARPGRESGCEYPRGMDERVAKGSNRMNELDRMRRQIIAELGVAPRIDAGVEVRDRIDFIKQYLAAAHATTLVLGISGGQDSTLAGRLCQLAVEEIRDAGGTAEFIAVRLPYAVQHDESDAQGALDGLRLAGRPVRRPDRTLAFNIGAPVDAFAEVFDGAFGAPLTDFNKGNVKARARMVAQYAIAGQTQGHRTRLMAEQGAVPGSFVKTLIDWPWKIMVSERPAEGRRVRLFNLNDDPYETVDLAAEHAAKAERMERRLWRTFDPENPIVEGRLPIPADVDEETRRKLEALGY